MNDGRPPARPDAPRLRVFHFNVWAPRLEPIDVFLSQLPQMDVRLRVSDPQDESLLKMARLDCDWYGENARVFDALRHPDLHFLPGMVFNAPHVVDLLQRARQKPPQEQWWLIFMGHQPQAFSGTWSKLGPMLQRLGIKLFYYVFDEASRFMACFSELAPFIDVYVHDENPLHPPHAAKLPATCLCVHRSWVANFVPFAVPFNEDPASILIFLGSKLGLTPHRQRQVDFLQKTFKDKFIAFHDHSVPVAERAALNRYKISVCPEGRKFGTPAMSATHTDRPFWSGCLGMVPVSENSVQGDRLESLHTAGLLLRYDHGNLSSLRQACERALDLPTSERRRIYTHYNQEETVGTVIAHLMAQVESGRSSAQ